MTKKWLVVMLITALIFLPVGISPSVDQRLYAQEQPVEQANPEDFIEILQTLDDPLPATSYVSQDVVPDKKFTLTLTEGDVYLGNDVLYTGFTIDGRIPGPTLIVNQNDIVEIEVVNAGQVPHGMSIHAAYTQTSKYVGQIGAEPKSVKFKATYPGVYMYHCAPGGHAIPMHTLFGQYGMIVVLPDGGYELEKSGGAPDVELFLIQHEMYATGKEAIEGDPMYVMFNGQLFRYLEEPIDVIPGDFVRIYFLNIGPNIISTLHIVGVIWDHVYWQGHPENVMVGGQTVLAGPSDSWVIDFRIPPDEGSYLLVTHAFGSTTRGAIGAFNAKWDHEDVQKVHLADGPTHTPEELAVFRENAKRIISPYDISELDEPVVHYPVQGKKAKVEIIGNSFHPKILKVPVGTEVEWVNEDVFAYFHGNTLVNTM